MFNPPRNAPPTPLELLDRLDAWSRPGLTMEQFKNIVAQCTQCGLVTTRRVFHVHECLKTSFVSNNWESRLGGLEAQEDLHGTA